MFCPNPQCSVPIYREGEALDEGDELDACEECGGALCLSCKVIYHYGEPIYSPYR
jgi:hypothetical protein